MYYKYNNNTQIYLTSAIIQIKVKTPKLTAKALAKESSSGNVKCCCKKSSQVVSVEAFLYIFITVFKNRLLHNLLG